MNGGSMHRMLAARRRMGNWRQSEGVDLGAYKSVEKVERRKEESGICAHDH
jgi:hypothetical protein